MAEHIEFEELIRQYALRGVRDWRRRRTTGTRMRTEKLLGARIADTEYLATTAIRTQNLVQSKDLVPAPELSVSNIEWAFFKPRAAGAELMFDLVLWLPGKKAHLLSPRTGTPN